jgi:hypothetical protein
MVPLRIIITLSGEHEQKFRDEAEAQCLPLTALAKQIILKYLTAQQTKEN